MFGIRERSSFTVGTIIGSLSPTSPFHFLILPLPRDGSKWSASTMSKSFFHPKAHLLKTQICAATPSQKRKSDRSPSAQLRIGGVGAQTYCESLVECDRIPANLVPAAAKKVLPIATEHDLNRLGTVFSRDSGFRDFRIHEFDRAPLRGSGCSGKAVPGLLVSVPLSAEASSGSVPGI